MLAQLGYYICVPFAWLTRLFYSVTGSYGLALILFTLVVKIVILPFQLKSKKSMLRMNRMQGKIKDIQVRYANNKEKQNQEMADLYAREGINPMGGCLWSFLPFPILIALYYIIRVPLRYFMSMSTEAIEGVRALAETLGYETATSGQAAAYEQIYLAKFVHENWASFQGKFDRLIDLDYNFLGMDLANTVSNVIHNFKDAGWSGWGLILLPILAAGTQFAMSLVTMKQQGDAAQNGTGKAMIYMMPLMTLWFGYMLPAALMIYWIANAVFSLIQELLLNKYFNKILDREETDKEREKREARYAKRQAAMANYNRQMAEQQAKGDKKIKQKQAEKKAQQAERKAPGTNENGRVGQRPYARGRSFSEDHYSE